MIPAAGVPQWSIDSRAVRTAGAGRARALYHAGGIGCRERRVLINCVVYEKGVRLKDIAIADISEWMGRPGCFVWVALSESTPEELAALQEEFNLHDLAIEDVLLGDQRPKIEEYDATLFVVLHMVDCLGSELHVGELAVFLGTDFVLSVRRGSQQGMQEVRQRAEREPELLQFGPGYVFYALTDAVVDRYFPAVETLAHELEAIEAVMFKSGGGKDNIRKLYHLKQQVERLRHSVAPLIDAVGKLLSAARVPPLLANTSTYFRDVHDHLQSITGAIDSLRDTIATAIHANLALVGSRFHQQLHVQPRRSLRRIEPRLRAQRVSRRRRAPPPFPQFRLHGRRRELGLPDVRRPHRALGKTAPRRTAIPDRDQRCRAACADRPLW